MLFNKLFTSESALYQLKLKQVIKFTTILQIVQIVPTTPLKIILLITFESFLMHFLAF